MLLHEKKNFRGAVAKVHEGLKVEGYKKIMIVKSIEFFLDCEAPTKVNTNHKDDNNTTNVQHRLLQIQQQEQQQILPRRSLEFVCFVDDCRSPSSRGQEGVQVENL